ncbi:MAG: GNAT family N-acetyltransferase [Hyphomicrobiales bacterium]|nr:GNAT family N-acetyltransferase [Hyphomicrobiales bacterium]
MKNVDLVQLSLSALSALADADLVAANIAAPISLGPYFIDPECRGIWQRRAFQVKADPLSAAWITRAIVDADDRVAVGLAGFHGPPNNEGMVEIGYRVDPAFRRQGYARAALVALLKWAQDDKSIRTVRATISPDNLASKALVDQFGFVEVGEQWDDEDGLETIFEVDARAS